MLDLRFSFIYKIYHLIFVIESNYQLLYSFSLLQFNISINYDVPEGQIIEYSVKIFENSVKIEVG